MNDVFKVIGDYWDRRSVDFDKDHDTEDMDAWKVALERLLGEDKTKNVLDLGTGTGFLANLTASLGYSTVGMDLSAEMMRYAVRHAFESGSSAMYLCGNALNLPFVDDSVDNIVNARLLWTIVEPGKMLSEWFRVLRPNGRIFCFNRMAEGIGLRTNGENGFFYDGAEADAALSIKDASMQELIALTEECGYVNVSIEQLPGLTREGFDYDPWYVLTGTKPLTKRYQDTMGISTYWNHSALAYEGNHALANIPHWQKLLAGWIGNNLEKSIVDIATGTGMIANMLGSWGFKNVVGMDISEGMMAIAAKHGKEQQSGVRFAYGNAMELPLENEAVDVVINSRLLWTLSEPESALREWYRVLAPGGMVIAINELEDSGIDCGDMESYCKDTGVSSYPFGKISREKIVEMFASSGFKNIEVRHMGGCHMENSGRENWYAFIGEKA